MQMWILSINWMNSDELPRQPEAATTCHPPVGSNKQPPMQKCYQRWWKNKPPVEKNYQTRWCVSTAYIMPLSERSLGSLYTVGEKLNYENIHFFLWNRRGTPLLIIIKLKENKVQKEATKGLFKKRKTKWKRLFYMPRTRGWSRNARVDALSPACTNIFCTSDVSYLCVQDPGAPSACKLKHVERDIYFCPWQGCHRRGARSPCSNSVAIICRCDEGCSANFGTASASRWRRVNCSWGVGATYRLGDGCWPDPPFLRLRDPC